MTPAEDMTPGQTVSLDELPPDPFDDIHLHAVCSRCFPLGHAAGLRVNVLAVEIEMVKVLPLPRRVRTRILERIARREFGDHPEFSEWWR